MNPATAVVLAFDIIAAPVVIAAGACLIRGEIMAKREITPEAARLLEEAHADYTGHQGVANRASFDKKLQHDLAQRPAADYDADGVLRDGSEG